MRPVPRDSLVLILTLYVSLGVVYSAMSPVFEAPDERQHYGYVRHLATERRLPSRAEESAAEHEASQPPFYYAVAALATAWRDHEPLLSLPENRFYGSYQAPGTVNDNKNVYLHTEFGLFHWSGTVLTVRFTRLVNLLFGALAVVATYLLGQEVGGEERVLPVCAAAFVAFTPQFLFISTAINNDMAVTAFSTLALWLLIGGVRRGYSLSRAGLLGAAIGLAALSKVSGLALLPFALLVVGLQTWQGPAASRSGRHWRSAATRCAVVLLTALVVGGWWYVRNALLYRDLLGVQTHFETPWRHAEPLPFRSLRSQLPGVALSFWAAFGMGNIQLPGVVYLFVGSVVVLAAAGLAVWAAAGWRAKRQPGPRAWSLALLAAWVVVVLMALLRWMQLVKAPLGRLLFPAIGAMSILIVWGLAQLISHGLKQSRRDSSLRARPLRVILTSWIALLLAVAAAAPLLTIRPAYARPALRARPEIAAETYATEIQFGDTIRLLGHEIARRTAHPGEEIPVTLCWESVAPMEEEYAYFVHLLGESNTIVGQRNTYPGLGRFPTSQWAPGDAFCDVVHVPVREDSPVQAVYDVEIGWYQPDAGHRLPARGADGSPIELVLVDRISVKSDTPPVVTVPRPVNASLDDRVVLLGYDLFDFDLQQTRALTVTLYWEAQTRLEQDYTVFVHLALDGVPPAAQSDSHPRDGAYPTSFWEPGEVVVDQHVLEIPGDILSGEYQLSTGMYLLETGERLEGVTPGRAAPSTTVVLQTVPIEPGVP